MGGQSLPCLGAPDPESGPQEQGRGRPALLLGTPPSEARSCCFRVMPCSVESQLPLLHNEISKLAKCRHHPERGSPGWALKQVMFYPSLSSWPAPGQRRERRNGAKGRRRVQEPAVLPAVQPRAAVAAGGGRDTALNRPGASSDEMYISES